MRLPPHQRLAIAGALAAFSAACTAIAPFDDSAPDRVDGEVRLSPADECDCDRGPDCITSCTCDPDCPADSAAQNLERDADGDADADTDADGDADGDADAGADADADADAAGTVCGDGVCDEGETGASCGRDCCDSSTPCDTTWQSAGDWYCRAMNGGDYWWWTAEDTTGMCDEEDELGTGTFECDGVWGTCCSLPGGWVEGPCR